MARKRKPPEHVNHERWLVSYADFITLLFAFFTTLYAISTVDQKKAGKLMYSMMTALNMDSIAMHPKVGIGAQPPSAPLVPQNEALVVAKKGDGDGDGSGAAGLGLDSLRTEIERLSQDPSMRGKVRVRVEARGVIVTLSEAGFFQSGEAEVSPGGLAALERIAAPIAARPGVHVGVEGHTDNVPCRGSRFHSNWELSTARATFVIAYLTEVTKIAPERLSAAGYAQNRPMETNDTAEGRARNRRVDLVIGAGPATMSSPTPTPTPAATPAPATVTTPKREPEAPATIYDPAQGASHHE